MYSKQCLVIEILKLVAEVYKIFARGRGSNFLQKNAFKKRFK